MDWNDIASFIMSAAAIISSIAVVLKARTEKPKVSADTEKTHAETYEILSRQLKEAHAEIGCLREEVSTLQSHLDYEKYLIRGISRLVASIVAADHVIPWEPITFDNFLERQKKETKDGRE